MADPIVISPLPPSVLSQNYGLLRETGMEVLRKVASDTWTDHNLHDPGITLLEALCYAITENGFKAGMDLQDLVESSKSIFPPEFFTAAKVLPVAPVTLADFRKIIIDHPLIRNAWLSEVTVIPKGRYDVLLEYNDDALNAFSFIEIITTAISQYRVEITLPHWDETEALPLRTNVTLQAAVFDAPAWSPIEGSDAWFNRILLDYQPLIGPIATTPLWVVVSVLDPMADSPVELPLILQATGTLILTLGNNSPADQTLLKRYQRRVIAASDTTKEVVRYATDYRNLCEYFGEFRSARLQEVAFSATIEVTNAAKIEELLADVFFEVDQMLSPAFVFESLDELNDLSAGDIYDGPFLDSGFITDKSKISIPLLNKIYTSDIIRIIFRQSSINKSDVESRAFGNRIVKAVRDLRLSNYLDGRSITSDAKDCLQLVKSNRHIPKFSPEDCKVFFYSDGLEISFDFNLVMQLYQQKKDTLESLSNPGSEDLEIPGGIQYALSEYYPVQNDLPLVYGVGEAGLPDHVSIERRAQAKQLKGYLLMFEQLIAGYLSQLENNNLSFSSDTELSSTIFHQPLYHLPGIADILKAFDPSATTWTNFINDENNTYRQVLRNESESQDQFLDRRNRMMDHLLSRLGEHMDDLASRMFRLAANVPGGSVMTLPVLLDAQLKRRRLAAKQLIYSKSDFYRDLPKLQHFRLQAFGNVRWRRKSIVQFQADPSGINWQINNNGSPIFTQSSSALTQHQAERDSQLVIKLATQPSNYNVVPDGGQQRLVIRALPGSPDLSRNTQTFASIPLAQTAIPNIAQTIRRLWVAHAITPLEWRLFHLLPIRTMERRTLFNALSDFFQIINDPNGSPQNEKIFRLWSSPGFTGTQLLQSQGNFPGLTNPIAIANAQAAVRQVMQEGLLPENYSTTGTSPNIVITLSDSLGNILARSTSVFADEATARQGINTIINHLHFFYSVEGFYLLEHIHLFSTGATPFTISPEIKDPYSFQVSFVFPSGFVRDFVNDALTPDLPVRFREEEFRKYAERMIRNACPAHILPRIYWVHRNIPGTVLVGNEPCFDLFETRYLNWLDAYFTDQVTEATISPLRNALKETLNVIIIDSNATP